MRRITRRFTRFFAVVFIVGLCIAHGQAMAIARPPIDTTATNAARPDQQTAVAVDPLPDSIPHIVKFEKAEYPASAQKAGIEGPVILDLLVGDSGAVDSVAIVAAIDTALGRAAAAAARKFRFTPARFGGKPEAVMLQYEYRFSLDEIVDSIPPAVNFKGSLLEFGTRKKIAYAAIRVMPLDTAMIVAKLPLKRYLHRLSAAEGYGFDDNAIIVKSDSLGLFSCRALPACACSIRIIAPDHRVFSEKIAVNKGQLTEATFYLKPLGFGSENEIIVYGKREETQISHRQLSPSEIRRLPGFSGDAVKVIQAMPGVARPMFGSGQLMVRGAGPFDNKFFIDGIEVPYVYHAISTNAITESVYNGQFVSRVDFYPGGFDGRYGGAIGGVVDVIPRPSKTDRFHGNIELTMLKSSVGLEGPVTRDFSVSLSFRRSYLDLYRGFIETLTNTFTTMPYYQDYLARVDFSRLSGHHMFLSLVGADDGVTLIKKDQRDGSKEVDSAINQFKFNTGFKLFTFGSDDRITNRLSNKLRLAIRPMTGNVSAFGYFKYSMDNGFVYSFNDESDLKINDKISLLGGVDLSYKTAKVNIKFQDTVVESYSKTIDACVGGPFCVLDWKISEKLKLSPSFRVDLHYPLQMPGSALPEFWDYSFNNTMRYRFSTNLRLNATYDINPHQEIQAMTGTYTAAPHITDYSEPGSMFGDDAATFEAINPISGKKDAQLIHGQQNVIGYTWKPSPLFSAEVQGYINNQWNVTRWATQEEYSQGPDNNIWIRDNGKARMKGLEFLIRKNEGKRFFGWISYTLSECEEYNPWTRVWSKRDWDATNYLQMIGSYKITPKFDFGLRLRYCDGFWYTPVIGRQFYDADWAYYKLGWAEPKSKRMDPYVNLDLRFERKFPLKRGTIRVAMEAINLVNALGFVKNKYGDPVYYMPESNWYEYNFYGDQKQVQTYYPLGSLGVSVEF